jgi:hypothetical protein
MVLTARAFVFELGLALLPWGPRLKTPVEQAAEPLFATTLLCKWPRAELHRLRREGRLQRREGCS